MSRRAPRSDRAIGRSIGGERDAPPEIARSISDYAHSTPQSSGGAMRWLGLRPALVGWRAAAVGLLVIALLLMLGIAVLVGSRPSELSVVPPSILPSATPVATLPGPSGPLLPAGWIHVADVPRLPGDGVYRELDGLLVLVNAERGELAFLDPAAGAGASPERLDLRGAGRGLPIARDPDGWWIGTGFTHELLRFDPATRTIVERLQIGTEAYNLAIAGRTIYVTDFESGRVVRVDASTGQVTASIDLPQAAGIAVLADGSVLVASRPGVLREVDPVTLDTLDEVAIQGDVMTLIPDGERVIITRNNADRLSTVNPRNFSAGEVLTDTRISAFTMTDDAAWAIDWITSDVLRLDRETLAVTERVPAVSEGQDGIAMAAGDLWVEGTSDERPVVHRLRAPAP